jgi:hypothetical protein
MPRVPLPIGFSRGARLRFVVVGIPGMLSVESTLDDLIRDRGRKLRTHTSRSSVEPAKVNCATS